MAVVHNNFFTIDGELKENLDRLDKLSLRISFKQASDPIYFAFDYIDSKPLSKVVKEFASETLTDVCGFISSMFLARGE